MFEWKQLTPTLHMAEYQGFSALVVKRGNSWIFSIDTPDQVCAYVYGDRYGEGDPLRTVNHAKHAAACRLISMMEVY